jgi:hypothetical protein
MPMILEILMFTCVRVGDINVTKFLNKNKHQSKRMKNETGLVILKLVMLI